MRWHNPEFALLLLAIIWLAWRSWRPCKSVAVRYATLRAVATAAPSLRIRLLRLLPILKSMGLLLLLLALMRPQRGNEFTQINTHGIAIMMTLDVSGSMGEQDLDADGDNRLETVKAVFRKFVLGEGDLSGRQQDALGLVSFAGYPEYRCPLTLDHDSLVSLLQEIRVAQPLYLVENYWYTAEELQAKTKENPGWQYKITNINREETRTAMGDAMVASIHGLTASEANTKILLLLTDGRNNTGRVEPLDAAKAAQNQGIKIYAIGVGRPGVEGVDDELLRKITTMTGGAYWNATDRRSLENIYRELDRLERHAIGITYWEYREQYPIFLLSGLLLLLLERLISTFILTKLP